MDDSTDSTGPAGTAPRRPLRSRAVVAGVLVAALAAGGAGVGLAFTTDDDTSPPSGPTAAAGENARNGADPAGKGSSTVPDIGGPRILGSGYRVQVPPAWSDGTDEFGASGAAVVTFDRAAILGAFPTPQASVVIEFQAAGGATDPAQLAAAWREAVVDGDPTARVLEGRPTTIAGNPALTIGIERTNTAGQAVTQRSHLVINADVAYSITLSYASGEPDAATDFEQMLTTWTWDVA